MSVSRCQSAEPSFVTCPFGSLAVCACLTSVTVSPRLPLNGILDSFLSGGLPFGVSVRLVVGLATDIVSVRVLVGLAVVWLVSDAVEDEVSGSGFALSLCLPVTLSSSERFGSRPEGECCAT